MVLGDSQMGSFIGFKSWVIGESAPWVAAIKARVLEVWLGSFLEEAGDFVSSLELASRKKAWESAHKPIKSPRAPPAPKYREIGSQLEAAAAKVCSQTCYGETGGCKFLPIPCVLSPRGWLRKCLLIHLKLPFCFRSSQGTFKRQAPLAQSWVIGESAGWYLYKLGH